MNILDELNARGLIKDFSNEKEVKELLDTPQTIYCGFDPSAKSMHMGNFVMISLLMRLQRAGHRIIAVVGGATGMIGDPSGKSHERNLLDAKTTASNTEALKKQLSRFLNLEDASKGMIINNYDWISKISIIDYLRDYGKYFSINNMLNKEVVASRLASGISFAEFSYTTIQAVDFLTLYRNYGCRLQIGGSDQWGNLTSGLDLIKKIEGPETKVAAFTMHLITKSDGKKFGKSEDGALFLDKEMTSPYALYQYFLNTSDDDAVKYLKIFTFLSLDEIERIAKEHYASLGQRIAQKVLAAEIVKIIHGEEELNQVLKMTEALFSGNINELTKEQLEIVFKGIKKISISGDIGLLDALKDVGAASSKREAREFVTNGSILVNGNKITDLDAILTKKEALFNCYQIVRRGKKNYYLIEHL